MTQTTVEPAVLNEAVWQAWIEKGARRERATARKFKVAAGIVLPVLAVGIAFYFYLVK